ncbi:hypothetical protein [Conexibacter arvalis]|uniref:Uncharacterized protein n=1 Tax=Conexibacter arvalis TaxID=912552 RepID=A0A840IA40_9ACTN|nr:hypothetical protein [Conexibacter arvalis]MBB4660938.1 hypothetical protein [Conexibacter arvalis]
MRDRAAPRWLRRNGSRPAPFAGFDRTVAEDIVAGITYSQTTRTSQLNGNQIYMYELADAYWWTGDAL